MFAEQKKILSETKDETATLRKKVEIIGSKMEKLEEENSKATSSRPKRIPRDHSVSPSAAVSLIAIIIAV